MTNPEANTPRPLTPALSGEGEPRREAVVVIGAGLAGLCAALRLPGALVLDPAPAGGKARTVSPQPGWVVEHGPWSFTNRAEPLFALAAELGIPVEQAGEHARARYLVAGGRLRKAGPAALSWGAIGELVAGLFRAPVFERSARGDPAAGASAVPTGASVADVTRAAFGPRLLAEAVAPMLGGIYAASPEDVDFAAAFPNLAAALTPGRSPFAAMRAMPPAGRPSGTWTLAGGMGALTGALASRLRMEARAVTGLRASGDGASWHLDTDRGSILADRLVLATDAQDAARLLADVAPEAARLAGEIPYAPLIVAHWLSGDAALPRGFGFLVTPGEDLGVIGTIFSGDLVPSRVPAGRRGFATLLGGAAAPQDVDLDDAAVTARILAMHQRLTGRPVTIDALCTVRHRRAVATPTRGHVARLAALHAALPPGLAVAGAWCGSAAMPDAVTSGFAAAARLGAAVPATISNPQPVESRLAR